MSAAQSLVDLAHEELRMVLDGRYEALEELHERRAAAIGALGPDADRELLQQAAAVQQIVTAALSERLDEVRAALVAGNTRRDAAAGYARSAA